jgi:hypothetical protein
VHFNTITGADDNSLNVTYTFAAPGIDAWADIAVPASIFCRNDINGANSGSTTPYPPDPGTIMANWLDLTTLVVLLAA